MMSNITACREKKKKKSVRDTDDSRDIVWEIYCTRQGATDRSSKVTEGLIKEQHPEIQSCSFHHHLHHPAHQLDQTQEDNSQRTEVGRQSIQHKLSLIAPLLSRGFHDAGAQLVHFTDVWVVSSKPQYMAQQSVCLLRMCCGSPKPQGAAQSTGTCPAHGPAVCSLPAAQHTHHKHWVYR